MSARAPGRVVIIGAGPAGLTAACELAAAGTRDVVVLEATDAIGGLSQSIEYKGNRIDIGGHRFFSKSDWVMDWWLRMLPLAAPEGDADLAYRGQWRKLRARASASEAERNVMLLRSRLSRIYFDGKFFDYPLKADLQTARKLGLWRCAAFGMSYLRARLLPRTERSLEDFFINRFGRRLYLQFFKEYTEKVWGAPCSSISAEWGAQRVKSLSIGKALGHALRRLAGMADRAEQTSLIERFLYPKLGPGLMWEAAAERAVSMGVRIVRRARVERIEHSGSRVEAVHAGGERYAADRFISTMPIRDLVLGLVPQAPPVPHEIAAGLQYRDFLIVGLLYRRLSAGVSGAGPANLVPDNWIYVQEPGVQVGRLQFFNNWSPYLVSDPATAWVGMEYFCSEGDRLWSMADADLIELGVAEMRKLRLAEPPDRLDAVVIRMPKAYPGYFGAYARFDELRRFLDGLENLFLIGRNGMHRYNNQDHSMLSARKAVEAILAGSTDKSPIWAVNIGDDYHEDAGGESG
ncbi:MAG TPA: NAD(P)/FAD-dependent oxidoreductase [Burkholderiales bacterium]|nr:NAD(P)/FAD-dependent oxidoreductase [Burkholderiales bacterium]